MNSATNHQSVGGGGCCGPNYRVNAILWLENLICRYVHTDNFVGKGGHFSFVNDSAHYVDDIYGTRKF